MSPLTVIAVVAGVLTVAILINALRFISQRKELAAKAAAEQKQPELQKV